MSKPHIQTSPTKKRALALSPEVYRFFNVPNATKKDASQIEVNVVVLSGQAPAYTIDKIRFPLLSLKSYVVLDLPSLKKPVGDVASVHVEDSLYGIDASRLLKTDKMAYKTLKDELPLEITKSVVRATTKGVVSKQMGDRGGALAGLGAALLMDVTSSTALIGCFLAFKCPLGLVLFQYQLYLKCLRLLLIKTVVNG